MGFDKIGWLVNRIKETSGRRVSDDFAEVRKIVEAGTTNKTIKDYELSHYVCYPTHQIAFCTEAALATLTFKGSEQV